MTKWTEHLTGGPGDGLTLESWYDFPAEMKPGWFLLLSPNKDSPIERYRIDRIDYKRNEIHLTWAPKPTEKR